MIDSIKNPSSPRPILELFVIDIRSLALLRIGLAIVSLIYLLDLLPDAELFLSDHGLLPVGASQSWSLSTNNWDWSFYWINGSVWFNRALIAVNISAAILLLIGFHTRMMTLLCLVLTWSLFVRNPLIADQGQLLLRMMLLWSLFLPTGEVWSVDWKLLQTPHNEIRWRVFNIATVALMFQALIGFFFFAIHTGFFRVNLAEILVISGAPTALVIWLIENPGWGIGVSQFLCVIVVFGLASMFIPRFSEFFRGIWLAILWLFLLGIWLVLDVSFFPWVAIVSTVVFIPSSFWNLKYRPRYFRDESVEHFNQLATRRSRLRLTLCSMLMVITLVASSIEWQLINLGKVANDSVRHLSQLTMTALPQDVASPFHEAVKRTVRPSFKYEGELIDGKQINLLNEFDSTSPRLAKRAIVVFTGARWNRFHLMLWQSSAPESAKRTVADHMLKWSVVDWRSNAPKRASQLQTARLDCYERRWVDGLPNQPVLVSTWSEQMMETDPESALTVSPLR